MTLAGLSLTGILASTLALTQTVSAETRFIAVDRQDYVADNGLPDAYQAVAASEGGVDCSGVPSGCADPVDIHVGATPGTVMYHSFVHVALDAIRSDATVQQLSVKLTPTSDPNRSKAENVNSSSAVLDAYPLKTELPIKFDANNPPAYDATGAVSVGRLNADGTWSFDLTKLLPYWRQHGNTGAAIVPVPAATSLWTTGFDRTLSLATAVFTLPSGVETVVQQNTGSPGASETGVSGSLGGGGLGPGLTPGSSPSPEAGPSGASTPAVTAPGQGGTSQAQAESPQGANGTVGSVPIWLLILGMSGAAAVALLVQPISQAFASSAGLSSGLITQLRAHPRMFAVSGVFLLWSSVLSVYANTAGKSVLNQQVAVAGNKATPSNEPTPGDQSTPSSAPTDNGGSRAAGTVTSVAAQPLTGAAYYAHRAGVPHPPEADLFSGADNTVGLTNTTIQMCAHAALTFGPAFNIGASDLNVYWQMINAQGGIWGRKIVQPGGADGIVFNDDGYQPSRAVTAAQACHDQSGGDFVLLGGIGFDQIPAVRVWAEQNHMIYIHHIATQNGTQGLRFSFTMLPTLERIGIQFAQYYMHHEPGVKLGILYRNSSNWQPGLDAFMATLKAAGQAGNVVDMEPVNNNQGDYSAQITTLQARGSQEVFIYENALAAFNVISQASGQNWHPKWLLFPFNLTIENLDQASVDTSQMEGLLPAPAYTCNASNLPDEAAYKAEVQKFEAAYAKYDNGANLCGDGGDLLFATWLAWEQVYDLLYQCGPTCTRNAIAGLMLNGYHAQVGANCAVDFRGTDGHHGGNPDDLYHATRINGKAAWHNTGLCESDIQ